MGKAISLEINTIFLSEERIGRGHNDDWYFISIIAISLFKMILIYMN